MSRTLLFAIGLSAIDGLMCAFVAILAVAFVLQDEHGAPPRDAPVSTQILMLDKQMQGEGDALVGLRIKVTDGQLTGSGYALPGAALGTSQTQVHWTAGATAVDATWRDCAAAERGCTARLVLTGTRPGMRIELAPYLADSPGHLADAIPDGVRLQGILVDAQSGTKQRINPITLAFDPGRTGMPSLVLDVGKTGTAQLTQHATSFPP